MYVLGLGNFESYSYPVRLNLTAPSGGSSRGASPHSPNADASSRSIGALALKVRCGQNQSALITSDGALYTWGRFEGGLLGHFGLCKDEMKPRQVMALSGTLIF